MIIIEPFIKIEDKIDGNEILKKIEKIGRVCYKSENLITEDSSIKFIKMLIERGHESVLEHSSVCVRVICDRGVSHEIVRHRIASYSQESTRYCNYAKGKFNNQLTFIRPNFWNEDNKFDVWKKSLEIIEKNYLELIELGATPQEARSILPNSLKTEIVMTMNLREWRHFFKLRTSQAAHPQMRQVANMILDELNNRIPIVFSDIN